jgi:hypothetical protein
VATQTAQWPQPQPINQRITDVDRHASPLPPTNAAVALEARQKQHHDKNAASAAQTAKRDCYLTNQAAVTICNIAKLYNPETGYFLHHFVLQKGNSQPGKDPRSCKCSYTQNILSN